MVLKNLVLMSVLVVGAVSYCGSEVCGAPIFSNPITGTNPNTANPFTTDQTFDTNITVSGIGRGSGAAGTNANNRYNANSWDTASLDATAYFTWTLTPVSGYEIDFTSLTGAWQRSATGPSSYALRSSLDGFSSDIAAGSITGSAAEVPYNIGLGLSSLDAVNTAIEFRLYAWGGASTGTFSINDFVFDGTVNQSVPEPASFGLIGLGMAGALSVVRRRRVCRDNRRGSLVA